MNDEEVTTSAPTVDELFGREVKRRRLEKGWTVPEFADRLREADLSNYHPTTVTRVESGARPVRIAEAVVLANVLGVDLNLLLVNLGSAAQMFLSTHRYAEAMISEAGDGLAGMMYNVAAAATIAWQQPDVLQRVDLPVHGTLPASYLEAVRTHVAQAEFDHAYDWDAVIDGPETSEALRRIGYALVDSVIRAKDAEPVIGQPPLFDGSQAARRG